MCVIFKWSNSQKNSREWLTEWLFYYVADWPQPSNIWTCMCSSFLQAPPLIISVLLVTFSFSHSSLSFSLCSKRINTLYLDTAHFVFASNKSCSGFTENKKLTLKCSKCHFWVPFIWLVWVLESAVGFIHIFLPI